MTVEVNLKVTTWLKTAEVKQRVRSAAVTRAAKCAALVEGEAKRSLSVGGKRVGMVYKPGAKKGTPVYERGPAGKPPRLRSGNLRAGIQYARTPEGTYLVGPATTAWYGRVHEFGAKIRVSRKMHFFLGFTLGIWVPIGGLIIIPKRPFMAPALARTVDKFPALFADLPLGGTAS